MPPDDTANVDSPFAGVQLQVYQSGVTSTRTSAKVGQAYTYTVQTNAPSGDTVTVSRATCPGMTYARRQTFTWTPASPGEYGAEFTRGFRRPGPHGHDRAGTFPRRSPRSRNATWAAT